MTAVADPPELARSTTSPTQRWWSLRRPAAYGLTVRGWILLDVSLLTLWFVLYSFVFSGFQEHSTQHRLYSTFRAELALGDVPVNGVLPQGKPVALLNAPAAGLHNVVVVAGTDSADLTKGPGLLPGSPLPGQAGTATIFGRSVTFGGPFSRLASLRPGDRITVLTGEGTYKFQVSDLRRSGSGIPVLPAGDSRLTLASAAGAGWRSGWAPSSTFYVDASLVGKTAAGQTEAGVTASGSELPMRGDTSDLATLVFWLEGLLLAAVGLAWATSRWGAWQTWLIGVPVMLALAWGASSSALLLLPNLV